MKRHYLRAALVLGTLSAGLAQAAQPVNAETVVSNVCGGCHGTDGNSVAPNFPKLAGQNAGYLLKQLEDFQNKRRHSELMVPLVGALSSEDLANLAAFFSEKKPAPGTVRAPELLDAGRMLYEDGNPKSGVPACAGCHGDDGAGQGRFPRLASQHADYTIAELKLFATAKRANDRRLMQTVAHRMTDEEMRAVAEYLASQP